MLYCWGSASQSDYEFDTGRDRQDKKFFDKFNELYAEELALGNVKECDKDVQSKYITIENVTMSLNSQDNYLIYHIDNNCAD